MRRNDWFGRSSVVLAGLLLSMHARARQDPALDSGTSISPQQACYDVLHYDLTLRVDPKEHSIGGTLVMRAKVLAPSESVLLDLVAGLVVSEVQVAGQKIEFQREGGQIRVTSPTAFESVGEEFVLSVAYGGTPREAPHPPWEGGFTWSKTKDDKPWIATSCQGEGADLWWPCKDQPDDEPDTMDIRVSVPKPLVCASNGKLVETKEEKGWITYHWHVSTPINNYSVALNIAPYKLIEGEHTSVAGERFPVVYYVLPENYDEGKKLFQEIQANLTFFEDVYGPYPFRGDKCGVAETPHLGMEHQSITAYGNNYSGNPWGDDQGFDFLLHHEMSHEYWALAVTAKNWNDFWIHEGFGTYAQALYAERLRGRDAYHHVMGEQRSGVRNRGPVAPREPHSSQEMYFTSKWKDSPAGDIYNKGSWIVHSLRFLLGDETFFRVLRRFVYPDPAMEKVTDGRQCRFATTDELLAIAEKESGRDLHWFWELYLRQPKLPSLRSEIDGDELRLSWETPNDMPFPMPIEVEINGKTQRIKMPDRKAVVPLRGSKKPQVDPAEWILREREREPSRKSR